MSTLGTDGVLLYPSHSTPAAYHGQPLTRPFNFAYTGIFNVTGFPVTQTPLGLTDEGSKWGGVPTGKFIEPLVLPLSNLQCFPTVTFSASLQ